ncbi:MAG: hypothetical protein GY947_13545 [Rhodobacteraceae bacterium]|nr:hypothetical protein [Paracoccaceae bacterium]
MKLRYRMSVAACVLAVVCATSVSASEPSQQFNANELWFEGFSSYSNATLTVTGPSGFRTTVYSETGTPVFSLQSADELSDGRYSFELSAASEEKVAVDTSVNNGRGEAQKSEMAKPFYMVGSFVISRGVIVQEPELIEEDAVKEE